MLERTQYLFTIIGLLLLAQQTGAKGQKTATETALEIKTQPIFAFEPGNSSRLRFGDLEFRGGLVLTSENRSFGGLSALHMQPDGSHFIALSDRGLWLRGRIVYQGNRPTAIRDAALAPVIYQGGEPSSRLDTESVTHDKGVLYVGVERINQILRFDYRKKGLQAIGRPIAVPPGIKDLPNNQGIEALVAVPKKFPLRGTLIAISECGLCTGGDIKAFLIGGPSPGEFWVKRTGGYDVSDATLLPGGDLLILERRYSLTSGIAIRIRRIAGSAIRPGVTVDGPAILEADARCVIDNAEAISIHRAPEGRFVITILTDDNFSPLQRTLLLQFTMTEK